MQNLQKANIIKVNKSASKEKKQKPELWINTNRLKVNDKKQQQQTRKPVSLKFGNKLKM